jgi:hypothetical protein
VYPFDSGGFGAYSSLNPRIRLSDFALRCVQDCVRLVEVFWKNQGDYFWFNTKGIKPHECEADGRCAMYSNLLLGIGVKDADDRRGTAEVAVEQPLALSPGRVMGVVIPSGLLNYEPLLEFLADQQIKYEHYPYFGGRPIQCHGQLQERAGKLLTLLGIECTTTT